MDTRVCTRVLVRVANNIQCERGIPVLEYRYTCTYASVDVYGNMQYSIPTRVLQIHVYVVAIQYRYTCTGTRWSSMHNATGAQ